MKKLSINKIKKLKGIELLVLDFDGVLTDDKVIQIEDGKEAVICSRSDGMGISLVKNIVEVLVLSSEENSVVKKRCDKLKINSFNGVRDKKLKLIDILKTLKFDLDKTAFIGNDVNDLEVIKIVGFSACVNDSHESLLNRVDWVLTNKGGNGAVREFCDALIAVKDEN